MFVDSSNFLPNEQARGEDAEDLDVAGAGAEDAEHHGHVRHRHLPLARSRHPAYNQCIYLPAVTLLAHVLFQKNIFFHDTIRSMEN